MRRVICGLGVCCLASAPCAAQRAPLQDAHADAPLAGPSLSAACPECGALHASGEHGPAWLELGYECSKSLALPPLEYLKGRFRHSSTHPPHVGLGEPLITTSWLNRPWEAGVFTGPMFGDNLIRDRVEQGTSLLYGYRLGHDFDHYWGASWRVGWFTPKIRNLQQPRNDRDAKLWLTDLQVLYYPWGDSRVRPYFAWGLGATKANFRDDFAARHHDYLFSMPFGMGVKHHWYRRATWRLELMDNLAFGGGTATTMHNVSLTLGLDLRFGARQRSYWPWHPSRHRW